MENLVESILWDQLFSFYLILKICIYDFCTCAFVIVTFLCRSLADLGEESNFH